MSATELVCDRSICNRKERRFKTNDSGRLRCETAVNDGCVRHGTVVDLSNTGIRMLCEGRFEVGQAFCTELTTERSHGIYSGVIRRVEPWVGGQSILGCSLSDAIPDSVLRDLANEDAINRRSDGRVRLSQPAKLSWPLNPTEIDVDLHDYSTGGLKLLSPVAIPEEVRLRIRMEVGQAEELTVEARAVWTREFEHGWVAGVAFTQPEAPSLVADMLGLAEYANATRARPRNRILQYLSCVVGVAAIGYLAFLSL